MEVTKANLATYLAGLTPSATPYSIEITETVASDWGRSFISGTVGNIINTNTQSGVYLNLGLTIIPPNITFLYYTFYNCPSITTAPVIPSSVTDISYTFSGCTALTTAPIIPSSVTTMLATFSGCTALTTAPVISNSVTDMSSTFYGCISLTTAPIIPSRVTNMHRTFSGCTALTTAPVIPSSVTNMYYTFYNCTKLHTIQNFAVDVGNCDMTGAFGNCPALASIYVTIPTESTWHLLHTNTGATGTDYTIYNPDGTVAGSGTVAGTSQVLTLYGKSDELVISDNITPTLAEETATSQVQWHKSGLPYDDELMIFNAKNPTTVISNLLITTLRYSASFTLPTYLDGQKIRIANTHETNTITCTLPSGQTMNGQASFTIIAGEILELELIGSVWIDINTDYYSTTEQIIGKWIDGKPLYRKVINFGALPNIAWKNVAHGISNIDKTIRLYGTATDSTQTLPLPHTNDSALMYNITLVHFSKTHINIHAGVDRTAYTAIVIIEYTKTTD